MSNFFVMNKLSAVFFSFVLLALAARATDQNSDTLRWNGKAYLVEVSWYTPSVVETYFYRIGQKAPFRSYSSDNYRGHVASFEVRDGILYLTKVCSRFSRHDSEDLWERSGVDTNATPDFFGIRSLEAMPLFGCDDVMTDWFSGYLVLHKLVDPSLSKKRQQADQETRYLHVVDGKVVDNVEITASDLKRMEKSSSKDLSDREFQTKVSLLAREAAYRDFMYRCLRKEPIVMDGHKGVIRKEGFYPLTISDFYSNNPMSWPYNWDNVSLCGVPNGLWEIRHDSLFVCGLLLVSGSGLASYEERPLMLSTLFPDSAYGVEAPFFASQLNGRYTVEYGNYDTNKQGVVTYDVYKTQEIRVSHGIVVESKFSPSSFDDDAAVNSLPLCNSEQVYSVADDQLAEAVGKFKTPKQMPAYVGGAREMRIYLARQKLTDERMRDRIFRVKIGFMVNCNGEVGNWQVISKGRGELKEFGLIVLDTVKMLPGKWVPAKDKKGEPVDCWQYIVFTVNNGELTNCSYKE